MAIVILSERDNCTGHLVTASIDGAPAEEFLVNYNGAPADVMPELQRIAADRAALAAADDWTIVEA